MLKLKEKLLVNEVVGPANRNLRFCDHTFVASTTLSRRRNRRSDVKQKRYNIEETTATTVTLLNAILTLDI